MGALTKMLNFHVLLAVGMLITGSINTLTTKGADQEVAENRYKNKVAFNHPFFQTLCMFLGESMCLGAFYFLRWRARRNGTTIQEAKPGFKGYIFALPAMCDLTATSMMNIGLALTSSSAFQLLRSCVVVFTATLSVLFLKRKLRGHHWLGVLLVVVGTIVVGLGAFLCVADTSSGSNPKVGDIIVIIAQIIVAVQMVVEEKFIAHNNVPALQVVGFEGISGVTLMTIACTVLYFVPMPNFLCPAGTTPGTNECSRFEDVYDAFVMMGNDGRIAAFMVGNIFSIAFFNFFGVSVTKHLSAATRMVLDSLRTIVVWTVSLGVGWETFCYLNIIGFVVLIAGTLVYNAILKVPGLFYEGAAAAQTDEAKRPLLASINAPDDSVALKLGSETPLVGSSYDSLATSTPTLSKARTLHAR